MAQLPDSLIKPRPIVHLETEGTWLVMGDIHIPYHHIESLEAIIKFVKQKNIVGILLNGDILDMFGVSPFFREPTKEGLREEILAGQQFFRWLRSHFPKARIVYREGNHEYRLRRYVITRADALADIPGILLDQLLQLQQFNIEWYADKCLIRLGNLNTLHGHELARGGGINPARFAFLKTTDTVLVGHWHRTSNHVERTLGNKTISTWSVGCLCDLSPDYFPYGQANHGFAIVEVSNNGEFSVSNYRVREGRVE